jgi:coenzyme F420-reducing hydrogenase beta subunit
LENSFVPWKVTSAEDSIKLKLVSSVAHEWLFLPLRFNTEKGKKYTFKIEIRSSIIVKKQYVFLSNAEYKTQHIGGFSLDANIKYTHTKEFTADDEYFAVTFSTGDSPQIGSILDIYSISLIENTQEVANSLAEKSSGKYTGRLYDIALFGGYCNANHGASLTFLALHELLKSFGYKILVAAHPNFRIPNNVNFNLTKKYYKISKYRPKERIGELTKYCDMFVEASDQLWANSLGFIPEWHLMGGGDDSVKRISVATSFGWDKPGSLVKNNKDLFQKQLSRYDWLSVREASGVDILKDTFGLTGTQILDPIFLCDMSVYDKIAEDVTYKQDGDFVFAYFVEIDEGKGEFATTIKKKTNSENIFGMTSYIWKEDKRKAANVLWEKYIGLGYKSDANIADFIYNIKRAKIMVTDSFHGACFAVIFHKPFICTAAFNRGNSRFKIFDDLGLSGHIIHKEQAVDYTNIPGIDWNMVDRKLNVMRTQSFEWLEKAFAREFPHNYECKTVEVLPHSKCTGCAACQNICPWGAIGPKEDAFGFFLPEIDQEKCTECGLCKRTCPILNRPVPPSLQEKKVFCGFSLNTETRFLSSSGGFFSEFAMSPLMTGDEYEIYGAAFATPYVVRHIGIRDVADLPCIRTSKYVPSGIGETFTQVLVALKANKNVMFCGTPCQCGGLTAYLAAKKQNTEKLFVIDFVCHGVNSPKAYCAYLSDIEKEYNSAISSVSFRNKEVAWQKYSMRIDFEGRSDCYIKTNDNDLFFAGFLKYHLFLRESCTACRFRGAERFSDITLADAWGITLREQQDISCGVSTAIINTPKGQELFDSVHEKLFSEEHDYAEITKNNRHLNHSTKHGQYHEYFFEELKKGTAFSEIVREISRRLAENQS